MTTTSTTPTTLVLPTPGRGASAANSKVIRPEDMPPFMVNLRRVTGVESKALQFLVLTRALGRHVLSATWKEIDLDKKTWTRPATLRTMDRQDVVVPLSRQAIELLSELVRSTATDLLFHSQIENHELPAACLSRTLRKIETEPNVSDFRLTFMHWLRKYGHEQYSETMYFVGPRRSRPRVICRPKPDQGYARAMQAWADFCEQPT